MDTSGSVHFSTAHPDDYAAIRALAHAIWPGVFSGILPDGQIPHMLRLMYEEQVIAEEVATGVVWDLIAVHGRAVGYLSYSRTDTETVQLRKIYMLQPHRGHGVGRQALARVMDWGRARGCLRVTLNVNRRNAKAIDAYLGLGFSIVGHLVRDIGGGFVMDDHIMSRVL